MKFLRLLFLSFPFFLTACSTASGPQFSGFVVPPMKQALVYIYQPKNFWNPPFNISIDGGKPIECQKGGYVVAKLQPGMHWFSIQPAGVDKYVQVKANKTYYLKLHKIPVGGYHADSNVTVNGIQIPIIEKNEKFQLDKVGKTIAANDLKNLRLSNKRASV